MEWTRLRIGEARTEEAQEAWEQWITDLNTPPPEAARAPEVDRTAVSAFAHLLQHAPTD